MASTARKIMLSNGLLTLVFGVLADGLFHEAELLDQDDVQLDPSPPILAGVDLVLRKRPAVVGVLALTIA